MSGNTITTHLRAPRICEDRDGGPLPVYFRRVASRNIAGRLGTVAICAAVCACSPVMEATRPDPVDISKFVPGQKRIDVLAEIGNPAATAPDGGKSCDIYKLYTRGPKAAGKGAIAAGEIVADVFTLGLTEIIFTPVEAVTRNSKHTVLFCYDADSRLASTKESDAHVDP